MNWNTFLLNFQDESITVYSQFCSNVVFFFNIISQNPDFEKIFKMKLQKKHFPLMFLHTRVAVLNNHPYPQVLFKNRRLNDNSTPKITCQELY